jgi:hypothetical protein
VANGNDENSIRLPQKNTNGWSLEGGVSDLDCPILTLKKVAGIKSPGKKR